MEEATEVHGETCFCDDCKLTRKRARKAAYMRDYGKRRRREDPAYRERERARKMDVRHREAANDPEIPRARGRKWRAENRERANELSRRWAERNPEYIRHKSLGRPAKRAALPLEERERRNALHRESYYQHREVRLANEKARRAANPGGQVKYRAVKNSRRRARLAQAHGKWTASEFEAVCIFYQHRCYYCGRVFEKLTADHRIPLARGGSNDISNIVPACRPCNTSKSTKTDTEFLAWLAIRSKTT